MARGTFWNGDDRPLPEHRGKVPPYEPYEPPSDEDVDEKQEEKED